MSSNNFSRRLKVKVQAQFFNDHPVFAAEGGKLVTGLAEKYKIPTMYPGRSYIGTTG